MSKKFITSPSKKATSDNNLAVTHPDIAAQWSNRNPVSPFECTAGSYFKAWWVCDLGHEYDCMISNKLKDRGCPYCSNRKVLIGFNDLFSTHPDIAKELLDEKNDGITGKDITFGSSKKLWWRCEKGHEYEMYVYRRCSGNSCQYCSGKKVLPGYNDLNTTHPEISCQLIDEKNDGINATNVSKGSIKKLWWRCEKGHEYKSTVNNRVSGKGCSYCSSKKVQCGFNDLFSLFPHLEIEWDFEKNTVSPYELSYGSQRKVWWKCENGHSWKDTIAHRTGDERGCVLCKGKKSIGEQEVSQLVSELVSSEVILNSRSVISPYELDMYVPDKCVAIEFNGVYRHTEAQGKDKSYHYNKWKMCKDAGVDLVTVWEDSWRDNREVVETMLRSKLGVYDVNARDLTIADVKTYREANMFFSTYDLYGSNLGNHTVALVNNAGCPVAMLSWYRLDNIVYVDKYASSCAVENGLSTLLDQVKKFAVTNGCEKIVGMSNNEYSVDDVYELCGFERFGDVDARCWEVYDNTRYLDDDYGGNNIWDCGRVRWECVV